MHFGHAFGFLPNRSREIHRFPQRIHSHPITSILTFGKIGLLLFLTRGRYSRLPSTIRQKMSNGNVDLFVAPAYNRGGYSVRAPALEGVRLNLYAHIPQAPKKKSPEETGNGAPGASFLSAKEKILKNNPLLFLLSAAFVLLGWTITGMIFAGCITPRRHEKEVGTAYKMGRADGSRECEGNLQELRNQVEEKNDRLRKFNQIYEDGRLRGSHVDPNGK